MPAADAFPFNPQQLAAVAGLAIGQPDTPANLAIDALQRRMMDFPAVECPLVHRFTPGLYSREITMPAGALITSKIHRFEHPYVISRGSVLVWIDGVGWEKLSAPHCGITKPGTRRVLFILTETVWTTFHPTMKTTVEEVEAEIIEPRYDHLAGLAQPTREEWEQLNEKLEALCHG